MNEQRERGEWNRFDVRATRCQSREPRGRATLQHRIDKSYESASWSSCRTWMESRLKRNKHIMHMCPLSIYF